MQYSSCHVNLSASGIYFGSPFGRYPTLYTLTSVGRKKCFTAVCEKNVSAFSCNSEIFLCCFSVCDPLLRQDFLQFNNCCSARLENIWWNEKLMCPEIWFNYDGSASSKPNPWAGKIFFYFYESIPALFWTFFQLLMTLSLGGCDILFVYSCF